jgi:hypothetical protein
MGVWVSGRKGLMAGESQSEIRLLFARDRSGLSRASAQPSGVGGMYADRHGREQVSRSPRYLCRRSRPALRNLDTAAIVSEARTVVGGAI